MRYRLAFGTLALVTATASGAIASSTSIRDASNWEIGPDVRGRNYSVGMPLKPTPLARGGWSFTFPSPNRDAGHVHAVTYRSGPLYRASKIVMRYRIDAAPGVRFVPQEQNGEPGTVSLYFQRRGDNWTAKRKYEFYRWYIPATLVRDLSRGEHEIVVNLNDPMWGSVWGRPASANAVSFREALEQTSQIGIAFGSMSGRAHGVYSTGPARFTLLDFRIM